MLSFSEQLHTLLQSPYPFLYVHTFEEERICALIAELARALQRPIVRWQPEDYEDPKAALSELLQDVIDSEEPLVALIADAHPFLEHVAIVRLLRLVARRCADTGATVAFVCPTIVQPAELARDWEIIEAPLPELYELRHMLDQILEGSTSKVDRGRVAAAALGLTAREAGRAFHRAIHLESLATARGQVVEWETIVVDEKRRLMRAGSALEFLPLHTTMTDVGGLRVFKEWMDSRTSAFSLEARQFGLPQPKGLMLIGVQGCGKSLAAKAVAHHWGVPLLRLDLGTLFSGSIPPDDALRRALATATSVSPCVLWVDEIEKGFEDSAGSTARLLGSLLTWLQEKMVPVFFVATANNVENLPPELMRRGRFDEVFFFDLPGRAARASILTIHMNAHDRDATLFDLEAVAAIAEHFSGAELEQVVVSAMYTAYAKDRDVTQRDLEIAAKQLIPLYKMYEVETKALRTWAQGRARNASSDNRLIDLFRG